MLRPLNNPPPKCRTKPKLFGKRTGTRTCFCTLLLSPVLSTSSHTHRHTPHSHVLNGSAFILQNPSQSCYFLPPAPLPTWMGHHNCLTQTSISIATHGTSLLTHMTSQVRLRSGGSVCIFCLQRLLSVHPAHAQHRTAAWVRAGLNDLSVFLPRPASKALWYFLGLEAGSVSGTWLFNYL